MKKLLVVIACLGAVSGCTHVPSATGPVAAPSGALEKKPGTEVVLLGTGMPRPDPEASGPATAIVVNGRVFLFDAGPGVMRRIAAAKLPINGAEAVFIAQVQCREMMRILVKLGSRVPLHASGVGKAIFGALPDEQIDAILKVKGLPRITPHTIVSPETMWAALKVIRHRGYSFDDEEHAPGTRCVAAKGPYRLRFAAHAVASTARPRTILTAV